MSESYGLEPEPRRPTLPGAVVVAKTADDAVSAVAADLFMQAVSCVRAFGDFHLAVTGHERLAPIYRRLMYDPPLREFPWMRTHLWMAEQPHEAAGAGFALVKDLIVDHSGIPRQQVHPIDPGRDRPDVWYESELKESLAWREKGHDRMDFVLLSPLAWSEAERCDGAEDEVRLYRSTSERVIASPRLLNAARAVAIFATGSDSRATVRRLENGGVNEWERTLAGLDLVGGETRWYLDQAACSDPSAA